MIILIISIKFSQTNTSLKNTYLEKLIIKEEYIYSRYENIYRVQKDKNIHAVRTPTIVWFCHTISRNTSHYRD